MSKHSEIKNKKEIYWKDELHDDFDEVGLKRPGVPKNYHYKRTNPINNFFSDIFYFLIAVPILGTYCYLHGIRYEGKKELKKFKKTGGFIYANHVAITDVFKYQSTLFPTKRINIIGYSDTLSMPIVKNIARALGYIPLPEKEDKDNFKAMFDSLVWYTKEKHQFVLIYPEAHIWPYYTKVRSFHSGSFMYPSQAMMPCLPVVTTWKKTKFRKKPIQLIKFGKPVYPDNSKSFLENKTYLHHEVLSQMQKIADSTPQFEYIKYIKKED